MVNITVLKPFYDLHIHKDRIPGDKFETTEARAAQLELALPGYVTRDVAEPADPEDEPAGGEPLGKMTVAQLREVADERGIEIPKGAKKADIISLLEG